MTFSDPKQRLLQQRLAAAGLAQSEQSVAASRPRREQHDGPTILSSAQRRMWYLAQLAAGSSAYNFCLLLRPDPMDGGPALSQAALTGALHQVVLRHEILRTHYRLNAANAPEQVVEPDLFPRITAIDLPPDAGDTPDAMDEQLDALARQARDEPFNLETDAPLRAVFVRCRGAVAAVILVLPHIAGDGGSFGTVLADLAKAYDAGAGPGALPAPADIRYRDYALWEQRHLGDPKDPASLHAGQLRFWGAQLAGLPVELPLPFDRPRPARPTYEGGQVRRWLGHGLSSALRSTVKSLGGTPLAALQSAVAVALERVGAGRDIPLGTPVDLRQDSALDQVVGFFSNTVVVRIDLQPADPAGDLTFAALLRRSHDASLAALDHRDVPFESVVEHINPPRDAARNPLFGVMVTATRPWSALRFGTTRVTAGEPRQTQAKFDLTFVVHDEGGDGRIGVSLLYAHDLFDEATARHLLALVIGILGQGAHCPQLRLSQLAEFGDGRLGDGAADLVARLAARGEAPVATARAIRLKTEAGDADVAAALAGLLERHDALRLRRNPVDGRWDLADAAALWETPVLRKQPPGTDGDGAGFMGWLRDDGGTAPRVLDMRAPGGLIDDESWCVLLADLAPIRLDGDARPQQSRTAAYGAWLNHTAALAARPDIADLAAAWLDVLDAAEERAPRPSIPTSGPWHRVERRLTLPALGAWPDPVAIRAAAVAALQESYRDAPSPILAVIDEPDRDRAPTGGPDPVVGWCRRTFPLLLTPGGADDPSGAITGERAASYGLARDVSPHTAGVFDQTPSPDVTLTITVTDPGDAPSTSPTEHGFEGDGGEHWMLSVEPDGGEVRLILHTRRTDGEARALVDGWSAVFPHRAAAMIADTGGGSDEAPATDAPLVEPTRWDRRRLEDTFGALREVLPLSPLQEGLRFHAVGAAADARDVYISQTSLDLAGDIDAERLHRAVQAAVDRVPSIAAGFAEIGGRMVQVVPAAAVIPWRQETASDADDAARIADEDYRAPFDAARPPLIRFTLIRLPAKDAPGSCRLLLTAHHILLDGWSIRLLFRLVIGLYHDPARVSAPPPFRRYLGWLAQQNAEEAEGVWRAVLAGSTPTILYPAARGLEASADRSEEAVATVGPELTAALAGLARAAATTMSTVLELAWGTLLMRLSGAPDVVFGNVVSGRPAEIENIGEMIGLLFNTVPTRVQVRGDDSIRTALRSLHRQKAVSLRHSHRPLARLQQIAGHNPLFDTLFAVQNLPAFDPPADCGFRIGDAHVRDATHYPLSMAVTPTDSAIGLRLMFRNDVVPAEQAAALLRAYVRVFEAFVATPDAPLLRVDALPAGSPLLPRSVSGEPLEIGSLSVADLFARQAAATPEACAVVAGATRLTFAALSAAANRLAHRLQTLGVQPEHRVALLLPRSEQMIVALFGVFAAHAAYVPIDTATPANRIRSILDQSQPTVILTVGALAGRLPAEYAADPRVVVLDAPAVRDELAEQPETPPRTIRPAGLDHLAYIIFTSGSTGEPKGVAVPYRGLTNMFVNHRKAIFAPVLAAQNGRRLRIAHTTSFAFDASWEQLLWLLAGHEVHVIDDDLRRDPDRLLPLFDQEEIDAFDVTPTYGEYLVQHGLLERDRPQGRPGTAGVVFVSLGGEAVGEALWSRLRDAPGVGAYNLYGPTEYTINALGADLGDSPDPTVGRPIANTDAYILGPGLLPAPVGVIGELYLGGVGLARGYVGRAAGTAERFIANPFGTPGSRLYRTGDLARWRPDGNIDFLGRSDNQLKIRGYRIEPAEIENALVAMPGVKRAVAVGRPSQDGSLRLIAYVVCEPGAPDTESLRDQLRTRLPSYMVPSAIMAVDDLPMTVNGKLDVAALPAPTADKGTAAPPLTATERAVCDAFATVLDHHPVGRFDDFFDLGGHSLLTVRLVGLLRDSAGAAVSVRQIYDHPTPAALAAALDAARAAPAGTDPGREQPSSDERDIALIDERDIALMRADAVLPPDITRPAAVCPVRPALGTIRSVLLTGAAGFLGSYILAELLTRTTATIHCLVRAQDGAAALARVRGAMAAYGLWDDAFAQRLVGVPGDLTLPRLGLTPEAAAALAGHADVIVHNGGATNEFDSYARLAVTNVAGATEVLRLAVSGGRAVPVHFVSTASVVARRGTNPPVIGEDTHLSAPEVEPTGYVQSKWVAEELMQAAAQRGLPVTVHRPGRVSGHSVTGACSTAIGFWHFIRAMLVLGAAPELRAGRLTLAPVDYVAQALTMLIERGDADGGSFAAYHLSNRSQTSIGAIMAAARRAGYAVETMPFAAWRARLAHAAEERARQGDDTLTPVLLLAGHIDKYDGSTMESALGQDRVIAALAGTGIAPPPITDAILDRYIGYFAGVGFFPPPSGAGTR